MPPCSSKLKLPHRSPKPEVSTPASDGPQVDLWFTKTPSRPRCPKTTPRVRVVFLVIDPPALPFVFLDLHSCDAIRRICFAPSFLAVALDNFLCRRMCGLLGPLSRSVSEQVPCVAALGNSTFDVPLPGSNQFFPSHRFSGVLCSHPLAQMRDSEVKVETLSSTKGCPAGSRPLTGRL